MLLVTILLIDTVKVVAQDNSYRPLLKQGKTWKVKKSEWVFWEDEDGEYHRDTKVSYYSLTLQGDTIIDGKTYMKLYQEKDDGSHRL